MSEQLNDREDEVVQKERVCTYFPKLGRIDRREKMFHEIGKGSHHCDICHYSIVIDSLKF